MVDTLVNIGPFLRDSRRQCNDEVSAFGAIEAGTAWFDSTKMQDYLYNRSRTEPALNQDPSAPALRSRFHEIETNRPIFRDRDRVVRSSLEEIGSECRSGYTGMKIGELAC